MKKIVFVFIVSLFTVITACNNGDKKQDGVKITTEAQADSLYDEVDEEHIAAMRKWNKMPDLQKGIQLLIDSIDKLPLKAREDAAPYKAKLEGVGQELKGAYSSMENWMEAFGQRLQELNSDSLKDDFEKKIKYYSEEKIKISKIKEAILGSVQKADSLIKTKF